LRSSSDSFVTSPFELSGPVGNTITSGSAEMLVLFLCLITWHFSVEDGDLRILLLLLGLSGVTNGDLLADELSSRKIQQFLSIKVQRCFS